MKKVCKKCKKEKELNSIFFSLYKRRMKDSSYKEYFRIYCRDCERIKSQEYRINNKDYTKKYNSRSDVKSRKTQWELENNSYEKRKEYFKKYYQDNIIKKREYSCKEEVKEKKRIYKRQRIKNDPIFRMRNNVSNAILKALKKGKSSKCGESILSYLCYNIIQLRKHIENQFDENMNWDNYGIYWHIDHIIPQSCLPYTSMADENFKKCWALNNLRPLEAKLNIIEGSSRIRHKLFRGEI